MSYCTASDLRTRYGAEVDDLITRDGVPQESILATAIADADAEIDGYLAARYELPLPMTPALLPRVACDLARYRLWGARASEEVRQRYEDALRVLEGLSRGTVRLGLPDASTAPAQPSMSAAKSGPAPVFDRAATDGY